MGLETPPGQGQRSPLQARGVWVKLASSHGRQPRVPHREGLG